jgi:hypothetical protein
MLTAIQQRVAWEGWFGAEVRAYYFADLSQHYRRYQQVTTWVSLFFSSSALAAVVGVLVAQKLLWLPPVIALIPTGLSLYSLCADNQRRAADSRVLHSKWSALASERRRLWDDMYSDDAPLRLEKLEAVGRELSDLALSSGIPYVESRMLRWEQQVAREHGSAIAEAA